MCVARVIKLLVRNNQPKASKAAIACSYHISNLRNTARWDFHLLNLHNHYPIQHYPHNTSYILSQYHLFPGPPYLGVNLWPRLHCISRILQYNGTPPPSILYGIAKDTCRRCFSNMNTAIGKFFCLFPAVRWVGLLTFSLSHQLIHKRVNILSFLAKLHGMAWWTRPATAMAVCVCVCVWKCIHVDGNLILVKIVKHTCINLLRYRACSLLHTCRAIPPPPPHPHHHTHKIMKNLHPSRPWQIMLA